MVTAREAGVGRVECPCCIRVECAINEMLVTAREVLSRRLTLVEQIVSSILVDCDISDMELVYRAECLCWILAECVINETGHASDDDGG